MRLYDSAGLVNLLYNSPEPAASKTDYVYDLRSTLATQCKTAASVVRVTFGDRHHGQGHKRTALHADHPAHPSNCPSFGQTFSAAGTTYTVVVTGIYGNTVTFSQQR